MTKIWSFGPATTSKVGHRVHDMSWFGLCNYLKLPNLNIPRKWLGTGPWTRLRARNAFQAYPQIRTYYCGSDAQYVFCLLPSIVWWHPVFPPSTCLGHVKWTHLNTQMSPCLMWVWFCRFLQLQSSCRRTTENQLSACGGLTSWIKLILPVSMLSHRLRQYSVLQTLCRIMGCIKHETCNNNFASKCQYCNAFG